MTVVTNNDTKQTTILGNSDKGRATATYGFMEVGLDYTIISADEYCQQCFGNAQLVGANCLEAYQKINAETLMAANRRVSNYEQILFLQNMATARIHQIVLEDKIPIQFVYFILDNDEFRSLLVHFVPRIADNGTVAGIQQFFSGYDLWGIADVTDLFNNNLQQYIVLASRGYELPIKLSTRQHEIVYLLTQGFGVRQLAQVLKISYGTVSKTLREHIYSKFDVRGADLDQLIAKAKSLGYHLYVPQSLCYPCLIILDAKIRDTYFNLAEILSHLQE